MRFLPLLVLLVLTPASAVAQFTLVSAGERATVLVPSDEPAYLRLAAEDLVSDVEKITGERLTVVDEAAACPAPCVVLASVDVPASRALVGRLLPEAVAELDGQWEAYRVRDVAWEGGRALVVAGSDARGTMFGLYRFIEELLGVDPMWFWTEREPEPRNVLTWDEVSLEAGEPTFRYRGWFLNDEDLLVGWKWEGGQRFLSYMHYHNVTAPEVHALVFESMLRLGMNLVIPASFNDIANPAEAKAVELATERGLYVTMHHIEPLGVSGYAFQNYFSRQGRGAPFSIVRNPEAFEEAWRYYAGLWARYPGVVWQLGLRGIADRPIWASDPDVPDDDAARGRIISDAIAKQWEIVREVDPRSVPPATTTLWMEGARLHETGHLAFPDDVAVIFADNSPGWTWQADFYDVPRRAERAYGIYYHHQLWGTGPHFVQGVAPRRAYALIGEAVERGDTYYAMLNVGNVREFALGLAASAEMLHDFDAFDPDDFMQRWAGERFGSAADQAVQAYDQLFGSYVTEEHRLHREMATQELPVLLDGQTRHRGKRLFGRLLARATVPSAGVPLADEEEVERWLETARKQRRGLEDAGRLGEQVRKRLTGQEQTFFETNFVAQQQIMLGLTSWLEAGLLATRAERSGDRAALRGHVRAAADAFEQVRAGQALASRGRFEGWYRGDRKMNLGEAEAMTLELVRALDEEEARP